MKLVMEPEPEGEEQAAAVAAAAAAACEAPDENAVAAARVQIVGYEVAADVATLDVSQWRLTAAQVPLVTVTPNPNCLFVAGTKFESEGDPTRTCNAEHDHVSCGRCPYPGR